MVVFMFGGTSTAQAHLVTKPKGASLKARLASQTENLKHARFVCGHGGGDHKRWSCKAVAWLTIERNETVRAMQPKVDPRCWSDNPNVALGNMMARAYGWHTGDEWCSLYLLWNHESGWSEHADNPDSDACGIPQRMDNCANAGYDARRQIAWGLSYIDGRYGEPSDAYYHLKTQNFY
jgi:hypothetical protein